MGMMEEPDLDFEPPEFVSGVGWYDRRVADAEVPENIKGITGWKKAMREFMSKDAKINDVVVLFTQKFVQMGQSKNFTLSTLMDMAWTVLIITWEAVVDSKLPRMVELDQGYKIRFEELQAKMFQLRESYLKEITGAREERRRRQNPSLQVAMNSLTDLDDQEVFHFMPEDGLDEQTRDYFKAAMMENMKMAISRGAAAAGEEASRLARELDVRDHECKDLNRKVDDLQSKVETLEMELEKGSPDKRDKVQSALRRSLGNMRPVRSASKIVPTLSEQSEQSTAGGAGAADLAELMKQLEVSRLQEGRLKEKLNGFKAVCTYFGIDVEKIWEDLLKGLNERPSFDGVSLPPEVQKSLANMGPKVQPRRLGEREPSPAGSTISPQGSVDASANVSTGPDQQKEEMAKQIVTLQRQVQDLTKELQLQASEASKTAAQSPVKRPSALTVQPPKPTEGRKSTGLPPPDSAGQVQRLEVKCKSLEEQVKSLQAELAKTASKKGPPAKTTSGKVPAAKQSQSQSAATEHSENPSPEADVEDPDGPERNPDGGEVEGGASGGPKIKPSAKRKAGGAATAARDGGPAAATAATTSASRAATKEGAGATGTTEAKTKANKHQASAPPDASEMAASDAALKEMQKEVKTAQEALALAMTEANAKLEERVAKYESKLQKARDQEQQLRDEIEELKEGLDHMSRMKEEVEKHMAELQSKFLEMRDKLEEKGLETRVFDETLAETGVSAMIQRVEVWKRLYSDALEERNERLERRKKRLRERQEHLERERREKEEKKLASQAHRQRVLLELSGGEAAQAASHHVAEGGPWPGGTGQAGDVAVAASGRRGDTTREPDASSSGSESEETFKGSQHQHIFFRGPCPNCGWVAGALAMQHGAASGSGATSLTADSRPDTSAGATPLGFGSRPWTSASGWPASSGPASGLGPGPDRMAGEQLQHGSYGPDMAHARGQAQPHPQVHLHDHPSSVRSPGVLPSFANFGSGDTAFSFAPFPERGTRRKPTQQKLNTPATSSGAFSPGKLPFDNARTGPGPGGRGAGVRATVGHGQEDSLAAMMGAIQRAAGAVASGPAGSEGLHQGYGHLGHNPDPSRSSSAPMPRSPSKDVSNLGPMGLLAQRGVSTHKMFVQAGQQQFQAGGSSPSRRRHTSTHLGPDGGFLEALRGSRRSERRVHTFGGADIVALAVADIANQSRSAGLTLQGVLGSMQALGQGDGSVGPLNRVGSEPLALGSLDTHDLPVGENPGQSLGNQLVVGTDAGRRWSNVSSSYTQAQAQARNANAGLAVPEESLLDQAYGPKSRQSTPESSAQPRRQELSLLQAPSLDEAERRRSSSSLGLSRQGSPGPSPAGSPGRSRGSREESRRPSAQEPGSLQSRRASPESPRTPQQQPEQPAFRGPQSSACTSMQFQPQLGVSGSAVGSPQLGSPQLTSRHGSGSGRSGTASPDLPLAASAPARQVSPSPGVPMGQDLSVQWPPGTGYWQSSPSEIFADQRRASCSLPVSHSESRSLHPGRGGLSAEAVGLPAAHGPAGFSAMTVSVPMNNSNSRGHTPPALGSTSRSISPLRELIRVSSQGSATRLPDDAAALQVQSISAPSGAGPLRASPGMVAFGAGRHDLTGLPPEAAAALRPVGNPMTLAEDIPFTAGMMVQKDALSRSAKVPMLQAPGGAGGAAGQTRQRGWSGSPVKMKPGRLTRSETSPALTGCSSSSAQVASPREKIRTGKACMANRPAVPTASHDIVVTGLVKHPT